MVEKWITKKDGNESKHIPLRSANKVKSTNVKGIGPSPGELEEQAWGILDNISKVTNVDQMLLQMKKYSGTLGDYSAFNTLLIVNQFDDPSIVRSKSEWGYFGRTVNGDAKQIDVLYPLGVSRKDGAGKVKDFIEKKRKEGLSDEAIDELVREKFSTRGGSPAFVFGIGKVYDISQTAAIPGKGKPVEDDVKATALYGTLKKIAKDHYEVSEETIPSGARGYTAHSGEGQKIVVMRIPGEDLNMLHTLVHEMSHARLEHLYRKGLPRGIAESEAELSTYIVGSHFGFDFKDDSSAYIKGWLDDAKSEGKELGKENLDRVMNNARWIIQEISRRL